MPVDTNIKIPDDVLLPIGREFKRKLVCDPNKWSVSDLERVRHRCGPSYSHVPLDNVRVMLEGHRKGGRLGRSGQHNNRGASPLPKPPEHYVRYLETPWWKSRREDFLRFWDYSCAICLATYRLEVHHRTYERLGKERDNDCVVLCRACHQVAERRRRRERNNRQAEFTLG